ncbi:GNAT family N-acetyltransferase [Sporosarcina sp. FSL K6-1522]|uniref:GNAT family N-acetyltransferase n=1 Tax=Sporosarcina sp. FSL K6-1522 TaxID=2921554 RepID=UPI00315ADB4F
MEWMYREFEQLTGREVYEMLRLRIDVFVVEQNCAYHEVDGYDYDSIHVFCTDAKGLAAYARLLPAGVKYEEASIGRVIVRPDKRGTGLAHTLMEQSVRYINTQWQPAKIRLQAQSHLARFYGKHGFEIVSDPYEDDGIPHVDMILVNSKRQVSKAE